MAHSATKVNVSRDEERWEVEISAEIPAASLVNYREEALKEMQRDAKLDGFRPGKAPIERIVQIYGEPTILRHAAEHAIQHELPEILAAEHLPIVETPRVSTEPPEAGKPLKFIARAALAPQIELPDYKKIAAKHATKEEVSVSDQEHAEAMAHLRRERARIAKIESGIDPQKAHEEARALAEADLPVLDDQFVQSLGYENTEKFSEALRANIKNEKELQALQKRRAAVIDGLVEGSKIRYPSVLLEYELDDMEARLRADLEAIGQTQESFLAEQEKSRDELRKSWEDAADKRAKIRLILSEIARKERIEPKQEDLERELDHAKKHYPGADPETLRAHIAHAMRNELVLQWLESTS